MAGVRRVIWLAGLALALASLWLAPAALAASPANDHFANAEMLGSGLPVGVAGTNEGATKEAGEPNHGTFSSVGRSVWFEWEAPQTAVVTFGACESDFNATLAVYVGAAVNSLAEVVGGRGSGCVSPRSQVIFEAQAGTTYKIAVDGDGFFPPGGGPPGIEGAFELRIEETPIPTNDDFADAVALSSELHEGSFYFASASGSSWNATKETGEPSHAGDPGGASVWYSWFAPSSGAARVSTCFGRPGLLDVYTGSSVSSLTPVVSATRSFSCSVEFPAEAGTVYRIAVDGKLDTKTGIAESNDFQLMIFLRPTILMEQASGPPAISVPDVSPPETRIQKRFLKRMPPTVVMDFTSNEPESTFRCKLDKRRYTACRSPRKLKNLKPGRHIFKVVAVDAAGNADPTPATATFSIPKPRSR